MLLRKTKIILCIYQVELHLKIIIVHFWNMIVQLIVM
ncbi:hypothetical protein [Salmonella phage SD-2_S15]|nr:hypothetical protein [Salmonella phage SD-2_S15]